MIINLYDMLQDSLHFYLRSSATCHQIAGYRILKEAALSKGSGRAFIQKIEVVWHRDCDCDPSFFMQTVSCYISTGQRREDKRKGNTILH